MGRRLLRWLVMFLAVLMMIGSVGIIGGWWLMAFCVVFLGWNGEWLAAGAVAVALSAWSALFLHDAVSDTQITIHEALDVLAQRKGGNRP